MAGVKTIAQTLEDAKTAANTELGKVASAQTDYTDAGGSTANTAYTEVTAAKNALNSAITSNVTADIVSATTTLTNKLGALKTATDALTELANAKIAANTEQGKVPAMQAAYMYYNVYGSDSSNPVYTDVTAAKDALISAVNSDDTADIVSKTGVLSTKLEKLSLETITWAAASWDWNGVTIAVFETAGITGITDIPALETALQNRYTNVTFTKAEIQEEVDKI